MLWKIFARRPKGSVDFEDYASECYRKGVIAVGWSGLGDLNRIASLNDLKQKFVKRYGGNVRSVAQGAGALWSFRTFVKRGDYVLCPDSDSKCYYLGKVISERVFYNMASLGGRCNFSHRRKVKWLGRLDRNQVRLVFSGGGFGGNRTVSRITSGVNRLLRLLKKRPGKPVLRKTLPSQPDKEWGLAVEKRAMKWLRERGYNPVDESRFNKGWDIECGDAKFEVKGRKDERTAVRLTENEWKAARRHTSKYSVLIFTAPTREKLKTANPIQLPNPSRTANWNKKVLYEYILIE